MEIRKEKKFDSEINAPAISPGSYSSITVYNQDSLGTLIIGFLAVILLFRLVRFEKLSDFNKKTQLLIR